MLKYLRSMFAWRDLEAPQKYDTWQYQHNAVTGQRRAICIGSSANQPVRANWLRRGDVLVDRWGISHITNGRPQ